jgi:hypothetical protein
MRTRRRFSAEFKAKVALEAIKGHEIRRRLSEFSSKSGRIPDALPAFGRPIGVIVNYTPDRAIRFDLDGNALEILPRAHCLAEVNVAIRDRSLPPETLRAVMPVK